MKITTSRETLIKPLQKIAGIVERRQTLPILANTLVNVDRNTAWLTATDLEVELQTRIEVETEGEGSFTVPARKMLDICKALPDGAGVHISVGGDRVTLRSGKSRFTLSLLPAEDFPNVEAKAGGNGFSISQGALKRLLERTMFAMAHQDVRYYLNGMLLELSRERIRAVATDGHRMAVSEEVCEGADAERIQIILPRKAVLELVRLLDESDQVARCEVSANHLKVVLDDTLFITKLVEGKFPDYERVLPVGNDKVVLADRESLRQALARTSILSNEKFKGVRLQLEAGSIDLSAHNPEQDQAEEQIPVEYNGDGLVMGFNVSYLIDALGALDSGRVMLCFADANSSALIRAEESENSQYVVMPMRL